MRATWPMQFVGLLGFCLLSVPLTVAVWTRPQEPIRLPAAPPAPRRPYRSRSQKELRAGWWHWLLAHQAADDELEAFEERAFEPFAAADREQCLRQLLARDRSGDLRQAAAKAERAVTLAQTLAETYEATTLRAVVACELGHHRAELKQAQALMKLAPRNPVSLMYLRRVALCNGLKTLAQQAAARLSKCPPSRGSSAQRRSPDRLAVQRGLAWRARRHQAVAGGLRSARPKTRFEPLADVARDAPLPPTVEPGRPRIDVAGQILRVLLGNPLLERSPWHRLLAVLHTALLPATDTGSREAHHINDDANRLTKLVYRW